MIKPYFQDAMVQIYLGDCREILPSLPKVDLVLTDPPYGLSFMGKDWDKAVPPMEIWQQCLNLLDDGAFAFVMSIPRQDCLARMIVSLGDAGFETGFTSLYWAYASGFPKAQNISKAVDKRLGAEREVVGIPQYPDGSKARKTATDFNGEYRGQDTITTPATPQAQALDGSYGGFQPKPAVEVILVCMKPLSEKTYVDQALKNGKGISWLDSARIPYDATGKPSDQWYSKKGGILKKEKQDGAFPVMRQGQQWQDNPTGRFPANIICSDDVLNDGRIIKGGKASVNSGDMGYHGTNHKSYRIYEQTDSGSFSRYFDLDKWAETLPFLIVPKASKREKNKGCEGLPKQDRTTLNNYTSPSEGRTASKSGSPQHNSHPCVKPLKLMAYLITLGSREGDIILDPFMGSGTTLLAAQKMGRKAIGIEIEERYCEIAAKRMSQGVLL